MPDKRHHFEDNDQKLTIKKLSEKDTGLYTCVSENRAGFAEKFWKVEVYIQPTLIWHPEPLSSPLEGESISLECEAEGNPKACFHNECFLLIRLACLPISIILKTILSQRSRGTKMARFCLRQKDM